MTALKTETKKDTYTIKTTCAHCGDVIVYRWDARHQECDDCANWLNSTFAEDFYDDYSDADPGL